MITNLLVSFRRLGIAIPKPIERSDIKSVLICHSFNIVRRSSILKSLPQSRIEPDDLQESLELILWHCSLARSNSIH